MLSLISLLPQARRRYEFLLWNHPVACVYIRTNLGLFSCVWYLAAMESTGYKPYFDPEYDTLMERMHPPRSPPPIPTFGTSNNIWVFVSLFWWSICWCACLGLVLQGLYRQWYVWGLHPCEGPVQFHSSLDSYGLLCVSRFLVYSNGPHHHIHTIIVGTVLCSWWWLPS